MTSQLNAFGSEACCQQWPSPSGSETRGVGAGGRHKAALARLHSARSLNRSQGFTAGCRGSSLAPLGRRSFIALIRGKKTAFGNRIPKNQPNIIRSYWYYGKHEFHPAEKSTKVAEMLIDWLTEPGDTILEPFMGSGTILVAARASGRKAVAIEVEKEYCDVAIRRLQQQSLFTTT